MKPAVDEMFPEGAGPYVDLDEGIVRKIIQNNCQWHTVLTKICNIANSSVHCTCGAGNGVQKDRPDDGVDKITLFQAGGSTGLLMDLAANEKAVHADFFNNFEDMFDDDDIQ
ncbi:COP9 signalosome complex subunit 9 [Varanus komodoensis]|nr:COP9 signalosome complex subunit 9 [Varanus komodoensis]